MAWHGCFGNPCVFCFPRDTALMDKQERYHYLDMLERAERFNSEAKRNWSIFPVGVLF